VVIVEVGSEQPGPWSQNLTEHSLTIYVENAKWKAQNEICRRLCVYSFFVLNFYPPIGKCKKQPEQPSNQNNENGNK